MPEPQVSVQGTPNPNAAKFTTDRVLVEGGGSKSFFDPVAAGEDPLAESLFEIDGVESLLIAEDFVTVTKSPDADWDDLIPQVEETIRAALA